MRTTLDEVKKESFSHPAYDAILGGTTEGRAVKVADKPTSIKENGRRYNGTLTGGMDGENGKLPPKQHLLVDLPTRLPPNSTGLWMKQAGRYIFLSYVLKGSILHAPKTSSGVKTMQMPFTG